MKRVVWLLAVVACSKSEPRTKAEEAPAKPAAAKPTKRGDIPEWTAIGELGKKPTTPVKWKADGRPILAIFSASWCPGCTASVLADRAIVSAHGKDFQIGIALSSESDEQFMISSYALSLGDVPVWNEDSVKTLFDACHPIGIPTSCLIDKGTVVWQGDPADAGPVLDAHHAGKLADFLAHEVSDRAAFEQTADIAAKSPDAIAKAVELSHGRAGWQNSLAWDLVDRDGATQVEIALGLALARDAVASDGGVDFAHLDTYALALSRAGRAEDAAYVGARVIEVCDAIKGNCSEEKSRARAFIAEARKGNTL